jgi:hypothetical protein
MTCRVAVQRTWSNRYSTSSRNTPSRTTWLHTDGSPPKRHRLHSGVTPHIWGLGVSEKRRNPRLARENPDHVSTNTAHMAFSRGLVTVDSRLDSSRHCPKNPPQRSTVCRTYLSPFRGLQVAGEVPTCENLYRTLAVRMAPKSPCPSGDVLLRARGYSCTDVDL